MPSPPYHLIVIGTSAGGMVALARLLEQLPGSMPAAVLVVQHLAPSSLAEHLVDRLAQHTTLICHLAADGMPIQPGHLYLAPPDRHLLVKNERLLVTKGPHENHYRPAADSLFRSAAVYYGQQVIGVVLTGLLHDGTAGLDYIKRCGGRAVVQDPPDAEFDSMPQSAISNVAVDHTVPLAEMGALLQQLVQAPIAPPTPIPADLQTEAAIAERVVGTTEAVQQIGQLAPLTCPDCGGTLWQMKQGKVLRFRCHTGHAFTADGLLKESQDALEETLWVALRMLEERKNLLTSMANRGEGHWSVQQEERAEEIKRHVNRLREFLLSGAASEGPAATSLSAST